MQIWDIAVNDVLQTLKDRKTIFFLVLMPLIFTAFLGFVLSGNSSSSTDNRLALGIVNQDPGATVSGALMQLLQSSTSVRLVDVTSQGIDQAKAQVQSGKLDGVLLIPAQASSQALSGQMVSPVLVTNAGNINSQGINSEVTGDLDRVNLMLETASLSADEYANLHPFQSPAGRQAYVEQAVNLALVGWKNAPVTVAIQAGTGVKASNASSITSNPFAQSSPGMIVQFAIYGLLFSGTILVTERNNGSLKRLLTTPAARWQIIAGHILSTFLVVMAQEAILIAFGQLLFKVNYLGQPLAILVIMAALAIWGASLGLLIGVVSKREEHVVLWSLIAMFLLAGMGGAWFPLDITGQTFSTIGHLLPSAWAMDGFQNIILRGQGFSSVLLPAAILLGYAVVLFAISIWRFRKE